MKFAVIGAGVTGLGAAWLLDTKHDVTLYEAEPRLGGHANTVDVNGADGALPIDTGFIVYNLASYPNLIALFEHLDVETAPTDMGFAVSFADGAYEYSGSGAIGLIGNAANLFSPAHWRMTREIFRFFKEARATVADGVGTDVTLGDWLEMRGFSQHFINAHIVPMGSAIWSTPARDMLGFPFAAFARFFENHGLLQAFDRPQWRTVVGGSRRYVERLETAFQGRTAAARPVTSLARTSDGVAVTTDDGHRAVYDGVLLACHADVAQRLSASCDAPASAVLRHFQYTDNVAVLHTDEHCMPKRKRLWASWNYISAVSPGVKDDSGAPLAVSYWMNSLQPLATQTDYFVTLNPADAVREGREIRRFDYRHPVFDRAALDAQLKLGAVQGRNLLWYAGSYCGYGFHEDGLQAGLAAAEHMTATLAEPSERVARPWSWDPAQSRIAWWRGSQAGTALDANVTTNVDLGVGRSVAVNKENW